MAAPIINPLLPNANANNYSNWVVANAGEEGFVNGIWTSIFTARFPTGALAFSINPEVSTNRGFPDLIVTRNNFTGQAPLGPWQIIYEGKSSGGENFQAAFDQLLGYATQLQGQGRESYLIAAKGRQCMFWFYKKGDLWPSKPMFVIGNDVHFTNQSHGLSQAYDIVNNQRQIALMLQWIVNNPPY